MNKILIVIPCADNPPEGNYDQYVLAPEGMDIDTAKKRVKEIVEGVKDKFPEEYQWIDMECELKEQGFTIPFNDVADCNW